MHVLLLNLTGRSQASCYRQADPNVDQLTNMNHHLFAFSYTLAGYHCKLVAVSAVKIVTVAHEFVEAQGQTFPHVHSGAYVLLQTGLICDVAEQMLAGQQ